MNLIKLIEAVKNQSRIYKNLHDENEEYDKEWLKVAKELQRVTKDVEITPDEAQDQWNIVLLEYMEYLRGNQDFSLAKEMDFLQPYLFTIIDDDIDEEELSSILAADSGKMLMGNENTLLNKSKKCDRNFRSEKKIKQTKTENPVQEIVHIKQEILPPTNSPIPTGSGAPLQSKSNDAFNNLSPMELIFLGYAKQLQKMPLTLQLQTKRKIADIMDEAELKMMGDKV